MVHPFLQRQFGFMGSQEDYDSAHFVLMGAPMDFTVSFQPGSRFGPQTIRAVSDGLEEFSFYQNRSLEEVAFFDAGDIELPFGNIPAGLHRIQTVAKTLFDAGKIPITIGGEHLITLPLVKAAWAKFAGLAVFHFDAHADLRKEYLGEEFSHATVMYHVANLIQPENLYQFGIRSGTLEEYNFAREKTQIYFDDFLLPLEEIVSNWGKQPVYVTIDIDIVDPAFAPGTGTPEPGGCTAKEILQAVHLLKELPIVGIDIVEVLPQQDQSNRTALLAAKIIREFLIGMSVKL